MTWWAWCLCLALAAGGGFAAGHYQEQAAAARRARTAQLVTDRERDSLTAALVIARAGAEASQRGLDSALKALERRPTVITLPGAPPETLWVEPTGRDTAAALKACLATNAQWQLVVSACESNLLAERRATHEQADSAQAARDRESRAVAQQGKSFWKGAAVGGGVVAGIALLVGALVH